MADQSSSTPQISAVQVLEGGCHCGAIRFKIKDFDLSKVTRCNCSICVKDGSVMTKLPGHSLTLKDKDGTYNAFTFKDNTEGRTSTLRNGNLATYSFTVNPNPDFLLFRHFCNKCGIPVFVTANAAAHGGAVASININVLDLKQAGLDIKEITRPEKMGYIDGTTDAFEQRIGEPWPHGLW